MLYFEIKDRLRRNLIPYTIKAFSSIPRANRTLILDLGCGTGEVSLALLGLCDGYVHAVDSDEKALAYFMKKADTLKYAGRIKFICKSILEPELSDVTFDLVIAEGILNVIGFDRGLKLIMTLLNSGGYVMIHDEWKDDDKKRIIFKENGLRLINRIELDESIWWNEYYARLEESIRAADANDLFQNELEEIRECRNTPDKFRSIIYVLEKSE